MLSTVAVEVALHQPVEFPSDVLAIKYAQSFFGIDKQVSERFQSAGLNHQELAARPGECRLLDAEGTVGAKQILVVGIPSLWDFRYRQIRDFARTVLTVLHYEAPAVRHVALTLHGAGYGLDEIEAFESEIAGLLDAFETGNRPPSLERISIVEGRRDRAERLLQSLERILPEGRFQSRTTDLFVSDRLRPVVRAEGSPSKPTVFVAIPFDPSLDNIYHYAIQGAARENGFICERADQSAFTGDVLSWIKRQIDRAAIVIADLSLANPNVYLEVGYAWGSLKPTVLLVNRIDDLQFDVRSQKCIVYDPRNIHDLEERLDRELRALKAALRTAHMIPRE